MKFLSGSNFEIQDKIKRYSEADYSISYYVGHADMSDN